MYWLKYDFPNLDTVFIMSSVTTDLKIWKILYTCVMSVYILNCNKFKQNAWILV